MKFMRYNKNHKRNPASEDVVSPKNLEVLLLSGCIFFSKWLYVMRKITQEHFYLIAAECYLP